MRITAEPTVYFIHTLLQVAGRATALLGIPSVLTAQIAVGPTAQVSLSMQHAAHTEVFVAADPTSSERLAVCSMVIDSRRNRLSSALYLSHDGGVTWRLAVHDTTSRRGAAWDPTCGFAPGGTVLFATLPRQGDPLEPPLEDMTRVHRSANRGESWTNPVKAVFLDNEDLSVDWTGGAYHGRIYLVGVRLSDSVPGRRHLSLAYSADGGRTFQGPVDGFPQPGTRQGTVGAPAVARDGSLLIPVVVRRERAEETAPDAEDVPDQAVAVVRVSGGGTRISPPTTVAAYTTCGDAGPPVVAVDRTSGPFAGRAYVAFPDRSQGRCQIKLAWSDDGERWSTPLPVDDPPVPLDPEMGPDAFLPQLAVNDRGAVGITWYDRREDVRNRDSRLRFTASADGGHSVMRSVPVSQHPYHYARESEPEALFPLGIRSGPDSAGATWLALHTGRSNRLYYNVGDYGGLAVRRDGAFQAIWVDNRTGVPQVFTAAVRVSPRARTQEDRDGDLGRVVSDSVLATVSAVSFDPRSCTVELGVELLNGARRAVHLPLTVRVEQALSQLGVPMAAEGTKDELGRPLWRVGNGVRLDPQGRISHTATFNLEECRPLAGRGAFSYRYPLDARLQGTPPASITGPKILAVKLRVFETVGADPR